MKEDKYTQSLAKNQVYAIMSSYARYLERFPKFIKLCMETPCLCPFQGHKINMAAGNQQKHLFLSFPTYA